MEFSYLGKKELLKRSKVAFLSSRTISSDAVLKCYDWATEQGEQGNCVISGFHSKLEKDILEFLLKGKPPIIIVLGRAMYKKTPDEWIKPLNDNRLLIVSTNPHGVRHSTELAKRRNLYIVNQADKVVFGSLNRKSNLYPLYQDLIKQNKEVDVLDSFFI